MADAHSAHGAPEDPNAAPMHQEVRSSFPMSAVIVAYVLAIAAIASGIIFGVVLANN